MPNVKKIKKGGLDQYDAECFGRLILQQPEKVWNYSLTPLAG